ncbi:MAG: adenylate/guanylate cyclase domain-containing protein [Minwuia sp.]|uniref:adenylate/guanylate cyclase domain-containing protein n=1 Tax=Minwuia sp. TaxID=2493630 RepID=UPI003A85EA66
MARQSRASLNHSFRRWLVGGRRPGASALEAQQAEQIFGFRIAGLGRLLLCVALALYVPVGMPAQTQGQVLLGLAGFAAISAVQMAMADRNWFQTWGKYVFIAIDLAVIYVAVVFRNPFGENLWTLVQSFRLEYFLFFFLYLGCVALTNAPSLVLGVGLAISAAWFATTVYLSGQPGVLTWFDLPGGSLNSDPAEARALYLHPDFFDNSARLLELVTMTGLSALLALAAWRGRLNFRRFTAAEEQRRLARETFSKYVPEEVAQELLSHGGILEPERQEASILFADIEGFTASSQAADPAHVLEMLNAYYDAAGEAVTRHGGIVTQFQGDGLLATFSPPLAGENMAASAAAAAADIQRLVAERDFAGKRFRVRIGIATGPVIAGALGGRQRQSYTVIGDTVNLAARLEQLNKEQKTRTLLCDRTAAMMGADTCDPVTRTAVRGRDAEIEIFTLRGGA